MNKSHAANHELSASEAAERLGVKLPTLYAYVSRGLLRSLPGREGRARRYLSADVEALRERGRGPRAAEGALRWGEPILESSITEMTLEGPTYRGHASGELAASGLGFEAVAELLWTGTRPAAPVRWPAQAEPPFEEIARLMPEYAPASAGFPLLVASCAARDPGRFDTGAAAVLPRARQAIRLLASGLALPHSVARARRAWRANTVAGAAFAALGVESDPARLDALDALLVLMADHELNASTFAARVAASTHADVYAAIQAGLATLSGPLHGAASDQVEALLREVSEASQAERVVHERARRGERIPGFGHPFYGAGGDARARLLLDLAWELGGDAPEVAVATAILTAMERAAKPPPNVDFAAVMLRAALGLPAGAVAGLFAVGRCAGWVAHVLEQYATGHLLRPRARYRKPESG